MASSPLAEPPATRAQIGTTGSILILDGKTCRNKTFDNRTGQISDASAHCPDTALDDKGMPVPLGTMHTMNSISGSFK
jgi:hypothetical protein